MKPSELREALKLALEDADNLNNPMDEFWDINAAKMTDAILDAVIAEVREYKKVGTEKMPLSSIERGYNVGINDIEQLLQSAKSTSKESE